MQKVSKNKTGRRNATHTYQELMQEQQNLVELERQFSMDREYLIRNDYSFASFIRVFWPIIDGAKFQNSYHIDYLVEILTAMAYDELQNVCVSICPGSGKSKIISSLFPIWYHTVNKNSGHNIASVSYDDSLAYRDSMNHNLVVISDKYRFCMQDRGVYLRFPNRVKVSNLLFETGAIRWATSCPKGKITGRHFDLGIIDDPLKPADVTGALATKGVAIESINNWFRETWQSRIKPTGKQIVVMQRLHNYDLVGYIQDNFSNATPGQHPTNGEFQFVSIPMQSSGRACTVITKSEKHITYQRPSGELLDEKRFNEKWLRQKRKFMTPAIFELQYNQNPDTDKVHLLEVNQVKRFQLADLPELKSFEHHIVISMDLTFTGATSQVAGVVMSNYDGAYYVLEVYGEHVGFLKAIAECKRLYEKYPMASAILVEDKANGPAMMDFMKDSGLPFVAVEPRGSKIQRANAVAWTFADGLIHVPNTYDMPKAEAYLRQLREFPQSKNDDMVDATTQALDYFIGRQMIF
jgi:predicted phage terminase large subunit-like protein